MTQATYIGKLEEYGFGVSLDYRYGDSYKMNQFLLYLIQNKDEVIQKLNENFSSEVAEVFERAIDSFDEFEVLRFINLNLLDCSKIDFSKLKLSSYIAGAGFQFEDKELFFSYPFDIDIHHSGELADLSQLENFNDKIVSVDFNEDIPLLFETKEQHTNNMEYFKNTLNPILSACGLTMQASVSQLEAVFG
jgi:hypothetical protein